MDRLGGQHGDDEPAVPVAEMNQGVGRRLNVGWVVLAVVLQVVMEDAGRRLVARRHAGLERGGYARNATQNLRQP